MLTVNTMQSAIGKSAQFRSESLRFQVAIIDAKSAYGKIRLLIKPSNGTGEQWVEESRLIMD